MSKVKEFVLINLGLVLVALGINIFKVPNKFVTGGVSGKSIILGSFFSGISIGPIMLIINALLLFVGFIFLGSGFGSRTIYCSLVLSAMVWVLDKVFPITKPLTDDRLLELTFSILLPAVGSAIVFNQNASTGGTDIVARILSKLTSVDIGKTLLIADFSIVVAAGLVFGIEIGLYSLLGLIFKGFLIDLVIEGMNISKKIEVISSHPEQVIKFIVENLHRGATIYMAEGAFSHERREVVVTILNRRQAIRLRNFVRQIDKSAFMAISNTSEIIGKGFRNVDA